MLGLKEGMVSQPPPLSGVLLAWIQDVFCLGQMVV